MSVTLTIGSDPNGGVLRPSAFRRHTTILIGRAQRLAFDLRTERQLQTACSREHHAASFGAAFQWLGSLPSQEGIDLDWCLDSILKNSFLLSFQRGRPLPAGTYNPSRLLPCGPFKTQPTSLQRRRKTVGFFSRVSDIINANVSDMLDRAEDPEKMVKMLIFEMEEQIETAREGVAKAIAGEKKLEINLAKNRTEADSWRSKAEKAIENADDTLARECLSRKKEHERIADSLQPQWERARKTSDSLKADLRRLEEKLDEAIRRRDGLIARQMAAEAQKEVQSVAPNLHRAQRSFDKFDRMERRVEDMEAEAAAVAELTELGCEIDREIEQKTRDAEVDLELAVLKKQLEENRD